MHVSKSVYIGIAGVAAGLMMLAFAFASGITPTHGQTPGATVTAAAGSPTSAATTAATTPAGTATAAVATTTPAGTATRGALTPVGTPTTSAALPFTGTGSGTENGTLLWVAGAGILLAIVGSTFALTGVHRRR